MVRAARITATHSATGRVKAFEKMNIATDHVGNGSTSCIAC